MANSNVDLNEIQATAGLNASNAQQMQPAPAAAVQAIAMQQFQFQQALMVQQMMASQQAALRAANLKSAAETAVARAAEISKQLQCDFAEEGKEKILSANKSRSKSGSRSSSSSASRSRSRSPVRHRRPHSVSRSPVRYRRGRYSPARYRDRYGYDRGRFRDYHRSGGYYRGNRGHSYRREDRGRDYNSRIPRRWRSRSHSPRSHREDRRVEKKNSRHPEPKGSPLSSGSYERKDSSPAKKTRTGDSQSPLRSLSVSLSDSADHQVICRDMEVGDEKVSLQESYHNLDEDRKEQIEKLHTLGDEDLDFDKDWREASQIKSDGKEAKKFQKRALEVNESSLDLDGKDSDQRGALKEECQGNRSLAEEVKAPEDLVNARVEANAEEPGLVFEGPDLAPEEYDELKRAAVMYHTVRENIDSGDENDSSYRKHNRGFPLKKHDHDNDDIEIQEKRKERDRKHRRKHRRGDESDEEELEENEEHRGRKRHRKKHKRDTDDKKDKRKKKHKQIAKSCSSSPERYLALDGNKKTSSRHKRRGKSPVSSSASDG